MTQPLHTLPEEPSIYPYSALSSIPARSLLIFAPHPDDEVFGCGGITALALAAGTPVEVIVVTDGGRGGDALVREQESRAAAMALAATHAGHSLTFWRERDRELLPTDTLVAQMRRRMLESSAEWILAPSPYELHPDHRALCVAACRAFQQSFSAGHSARLAFYEVGQPLFPNLLVDVTPVLALKRAAMACFTSQLAQQRYDEHVLALNRFRSYTLATSVSHVEALHLLRWEDLAQGLQGVIAGNSRSVIERLGLEQP